mmetsp:Transcript_15270/g.24768  ORF Transcript_15270/g.24768 Transcript_15270/m.24768 type:complete len:87 (-) Transcript_15270:122-382(-)
MYRNSATEIACKDQNLCVPTPIFEQSFLRPWRNQERIPEKSPLGVERSFNATPIVQTWLNHGGHGCEKLAKPRHAAQRNTSTPTKS